MKVSSIKTILRLSELLIAIGITSFCASSLYAEAPPVKSTPAPKRKLKCLRGKMRVIVVDGKRKIVCVVKKDKKKKVSDQAIPLAPFKWQVNWWGRFSARMEGDPFLASNRYRMLAQGEKEIAQRTKLVAGARVTYDLMSALQSEDEYRDDFSQDKNLDWELWDTYLEYQKEGWRLRLGQQTVSWGESFGFFYADVVNPKDLRERSLGRLSELRLPVPMANIQWSSRNVSAQFLYLPFFKPHRLPTPRSDFFPDIQDDFAMLPAGVKLDTTTGYELDNEKGDVGGKISTTVKGIDLSVLYFDHIDRQAYYLPVSPVPTGNRFLLKPHHNRIQTSGLTLSTELAGWIIRSENTYTLSRSYNTLDPLAGLIQTDFTQQVHVLGLDFPKSGDWRLGFQSSIDQLIGQGVPLFRAKEVILSTMWIAVDTINESLFEILLSYDYEGESKLIQARFTYPVSNSHELEIGSDYFTGSSDSFFGQTEKASRIYLGLRGAFNG